jgi:hypothetical protein
MNFAEAQREMRVAYRDGAAGAWVSGLLWLASAALGTWGSKSHAMLMLCVGGMFIFPLMLAVLKLTGARAAVSRENPLTPLALQLAFTVPLAIPLIITAARTKPEWFYAGFLVVVGAHYLPFVTLYGQRLYLGAGAAMVATGFWLPMLAPGDFTVGGWIGGGMLLVLGTVLAVANARAKLAAPAAS